MKAIKNLKQKDVNKICKKHYDDYKGCDNCPLTTIDIVYNCKTFEKEMKEHLKSLNEKIKV